MSRHAINPISTSAFEGVSQAAKYFILKLPVLKFRYARGQRG